MAAATLSDFLQRLKHLMAAETLSPAADHELLQSFLAGQSDVAFSTLMSRYGPLVFRVCRRVLSNSQDAEDAFQATFLVLARQAPTIRKRTSLACWLHGVAYRIALETRSKTARRRKHETRAGTEAAPLGFTDDTTWKEIRSVLDEELTRLPDRLRAPLVLCYLQGLTQDEAAGQLGQSKSTFRRRLEQGRELLASRLTRRGVALAAALFAPLLSESVSSAALSPALIDSTLKAAALVAAGSAATTAAVSAKVVALTEGALKAMLLTKLKTTGMLLLAATLLGGALAACAYQALARDEKPKADAPSKPAPGAPAPKDKDKVDPLLAKAIASALDEAESVTDLFNRAVAFGEIAKAQAQAGQSEAAANTLRKALESEARETGLPAQQHKDNRLWVIAEYQAKTGDVKGALESVQALVSQGNQSHALGQIASAQIQAGDVKGALKTVEKIETAAVVDEVLLQLVRSQIQSDDLAAALKTTGRIGAGSLTEKALALGAVAAAHFKAGKSEEAAKLFAQSHEAAAKADNKLYAFINLAEAQAGAGLVEEAKKTAAEIEGEDARVRAYELMAKALAERGDVKAAREVADKIAGGFAKGEAQKEVVVALIRAKDLPEAAKAAAAVEDEIGRCYALMELAKAQVAAAQKEEAKRSLEAALKLAGNLQNPKGYGGVREAALAHYAGARAAAGDAEGALEWAGKQDEAWVRVMARVRVVGALAARPAL